MSVGGIFATISEYNIQKEKGKKSMKINYKSLIINIAIPLAIGGLSAWLTMGIISHRVLSFLYVSTFSLLIF